MPLTLGKDLTMRTHRTSRLRALVALLLPLLMAASCEYDPSPPAFEDSAAVLRGTRAGTWGSGAEATAMRLENLTARRTGPATFAFEGRVRFASGDVARIEGTGVGAEPFADPYAGALAPSGPPPVPAYDLHATLHSDDGAVLWELSGARDRYGNGYGGEATDPAGARVPFSFGGVLGDDAFHLMGFEAQPTRVRVGEPVTFTWSMWTGSEARLRCRMYVRERHPLVEIDACATRDSFTFTYERDWGRTDPFSRYVRLEVSGDGEHWQEYETTFMLVPDAASYSP